MEQHKPEPYITDSRRRFLQRERVNDFSTDDDHEPEQPRPKPTDDEWKAYNAYRLAKSKQRKAIEALKNDCTEEKMAIVKKHAEEAGKHRAKLSHIHNLSLHFRK